MTSIVEQAPVRRTQFRATSFWQKLSRVFRRKDKVREPRLDPRELSDHLKRDLGFLDGRGG